MKLEILPNLKYFTAIWELYFLTPPPVSYSQVIDVHNKLEDPSKFATGDTKYGVIMSKINQASFRGMLKVDLVCSLTCFVCSRKLTHLHGCGTTSPSRDNLSSRMGHISMRKTCGQCWEMKSRLLQSLTLRAKGKSSADTSSYRRMSMYVPLNHHDCTHWFLGDTSQWSVLRSKGSRRNWTWRMASHREKEMRSILESSRTC